MRLYLDACLNQVEEELSLELNTELVQFLGGKRRLSTGELYTIMTKSRNQYHYAVRRVKKKADLIKAKKLFEAAESGSRDLLNEMKKLPPMRIEVIILLFF